MITRANICMDTVWNVPETDVFNNCIFEGIKYGPSFNCKNIIFLRLSSFFSLVILKI